VKRRDIPGQCAKLLVHHNPDRPMRVIASHARFKVHVAEQRSRPFVRSAHRRSSCFHKRMNRDCQKIAMTFSTACYFH
jgi:hypothetical protein